MPLYRHEQEVITRTREAVRQAIRVSGSREHCEEFLLALHEDIEEQLKLLAPKLEARWRQLRKLRPPAEAPKKKAKAPKKKAGADA